MSKQIRITVPDKIYKQLVKLSDDQCRSLSNQCAYMLKQMLQPQPTSIPTPFISQPAEPQLQPPFIPTSSSPLTSTPIPTPDVTVTLSTQQPEPQIQQPEPDNEYYKKVKKGYRTIYGENSKEWQELMSMCKYPDVKKFMRTQHRNDVEQIITESYDHTLNAYQFEEILDYLAGRDPDARNI